MRMILLDVLPTDKVAMQDHLIKLYEGATRCVQVMPLEEEGLSLPEIYGSVLIEQNLSAMKKTRRQDEPSGTKTLKSVKDMFYVNDKFAKRIILTGEAGYGKTVFCLKLINSWSKGSQRDDKDKKISGSENTKVVDKQNKEIQNCESERGTGRTFDRTKESKCTLQPREKQLKAMQNEQEDRDMQSCLSLFDLVFYVPLRYAKCGTSCIADLVCDSVSECDGCSKHKIKQMLDDRSIRCLVILDGLDEWRAPDTCRVRGFPDSDGLANCTLLCTMRPWRMINLRLGLDSTCDKVLHILGLMEESIKTVISNVLVNFFGLKLSSSLYEDKFKRFYRKAEFPEVRSLMKVPLILTASCLVWKEEDEVSGRWKNDRSNSDSHTSDLLEKDQSDSDLDISDSSDSDWASPYFMTSFYLKLTEVKITRGENKHGIVKSFLDDKRQNTDASLNVQSILSGFESITDFFEVIKPVGRLALQDLLSDEPHLVFPLNKLEREIGQSKVELALKVGILNQTKAPGLSYKQRISVSFYHKSIQEFIAALYMTCGDTEALASFRTQCNTVEKVMELSNMIMFVCGLDPVVGCQLSEHIKDIVNSDTDIIQYREKQEHAYKRGVLYKRQRKWYSDMKQNLSYTHNTDNTPTLHVTDVYIHSEMDYVNVIDVCMASELVSMEDNSIVSVYLWVPHPVHSIIQHLPGCTHLTALHIKDIADTLDRELLAEVLPQLIQLQCVVYGYDDGEKCPPADTAVVRAVQQLPALRCIELWGITLTDTVTLPPQLDTVTLSVVKPSHFILPSVCQCSRLTCIDLSIMTLTDAVTLSPLVQKVKLDSVRPAHFILPSLPGCLNITSLYIIKCYLTMQECEFLASALPKLRYLQFIRYEGGMFHFGHDGHVAVVSALQHLTQLTRIKLSQIDLGDGALLVTPHMTQLQKVKLDHVKMSGRRWTEFLSSLQHATQLTHIKLSRIDLGDDCTLLVTPHMTQLQEVKLHKVKISSRRLAEFVSSLLSVQHTVHVKLWGTYIDGDTINTIHSSPHFTVTRDEKKSCYSSGSLEFHTVQ